MPPLLHLTSCTSINQMYVLTLRTEERRSKFAIQVLLIHKNKETFHPNLLPKLQLRSELNKQSHTHTHTHTYIYIYVLAAHSSLEANNPWDYLIILLFLLLQVSAPWPQQLHYSLSGTKLSNSTSSHHVAVRTSLKLSSRLRLIPPSAVLFQYFWTKDVYDFISCMRAI